MREYVATAKTVEEAIQLGCEALSVDRDDLGVSYEILEMPQKTGFLGLKVTPAKVKVTVETADTEPEATPAAPVAAAEPEPAPAEEAAEQPAAEDAAPAEAETPLDIAADPRLQAAVDYLTPIFHLMGVEEFTFTAGKKGEAAAPGRCLRGGGAAAEILGCHPARIFAAGHISPAIAVIGGNNIHGCAVIQYRHHIIIDAGALAHIQAALGGYFGAAFCHRHGCTKACRNQQSCQKRYTLFHIYISLLQGDLRTKRECTLLQFHYTICLHQTQETLYLCDFFVKHVKNPASASSLPGFGMVTKIFPLLPPHRIDKTACVAYCKR